MTIDTKKIHLIKRIMEIEDEALIEKLEEVAGVAAEERGVLSDLTGPIKKVFDLEEIKRERNFQPIDKSEFDQLIQEADIQEPIEVLLEMI